VNRHDRLFHTPLCIFVNSWFAHCNYWCREKLCIYVFAHLFIYLSNNTISLSWTDILKHEEIKLKNTDTLILVNILWPVTYFWTFLCKRNVQKKTIHRGVADDIVFEMYRIRIHVRRRIFWLSFGGVPQKLN